MLHKWVKTILAIVALFIFLSLANSKAWAENPWGLGVDLGFLADTVDDTMLTMSFQGDYYPQFQIFYRAPNFTFTW